ncbi:MAG: hypothetical protein ACREJ4_16085 [Candidatus Methylomirabilaceae bacterium]
MRACDRRVVEDRQGVCRVLDHRLYLFSTAQMTVLEVHALERLVHPILL